MPLPYPARPDNSTASGGLEVSATEDGLVLISDLGADGSYHYYKLSPQNAIKLASMLNTQAAKIIKGEE